MAEDVRRVRMRDDLARLACEISPSFSFSSGERGANERVNASSSSTIPGESDAIKRVSD